MSTALITGSGGLIGSESVRHFHDKGWSVVGIDNDMRRVFFGSEASTSWMSAALTLQLAHYKHFDIDIRNEGAVNRVVRDLASDLELIIHTAAQPSHDWAAREPMTDFSVNALGTLVLLEAMRKHAPRCTFIFTSTNKVYGDRPNALPVIETGTRYELPADHAWYSGIPECMPIDECTHSLFGVSKVSADLMVQEYGRYFGLATTVFRGGCLTGPGHSGTELHGFLAYLMKCAIERRPYRIFGYKGKQVRDNIHSADLIAAFDEVSRHPKPGAVYNIGGGRESNCSMREAIQICQEISGNEMQTTYVDTNRIGDHIWWISDLSRFKQAYPGWRLKYGIRSILEEIYQANESRRTMAAV